MATQTTTEQRLAASPSECWTPQGRKEIDDMWEKFNRGTATKQRTCCFLPSSQRVHRKRAVVEIWDEYNVDSTDSCELHIYALLADGVSQVVPI